MWTNIVSKKSADQEHASVAQPAGNPIPAQAEALEVPSAVRSTPQLMSICDIPLIALSSSLNARIHSFSV